MAVRHDGVYPEKAPIQFTPVRFSSKTTATIVLTSSQTESRLFDVLIFLPDDMPGVTEDDEECPRVLRDWTVLSINPYVAFAMALRTIGAAYFPPPDAALLGIEEECLAIRDKWNVAIPRRPVPVLSPKDWEFIDM